MNEIIVLPSHDWVGIKWGHHGLHYLEEPTFWPFSTCQADTVHRASLTCLLHRWGESLRGSVASRSLSLVSLRMAESLMTVASHTETYFSGKRILDVGGFWGLFRNLAAAAGCLRPALWEQRGVGLWGSLSAFPAGDSGRVSQLPCLFVWKRTLDSSRCQPACPDSPCVRRPPRLRARRCRR